MKQEMLVLQLHSPMVIHKNWEYGGGFHNDE
jgi:hypothetical protein